MNIKLVQNSESIPTRASLLEAMKLWENEESWRDFHDTYSRLIYGVALKAGLSETEAAEALQETMITVADDIKSFKYDRARGSFKGWLLQRARWRIGDQFRKRQRDFRRYVSGTGKTDAMERVPEEPVSDKEWDDGWVGNFLTVATERVKKRVEPRTYQAYQLYVLKEQPIGDVAKSLGMSRASVYVSKHRVEGMLKRETRALAKRAERGPV
jgi:RNA polymerase sigma-70 factor (ECF subfamily)